MLSTWGASPNTIRGLDLASASYLTEPFGADKLLERIEETLQRENALAKAGTNYADTIPLNTDGVIDHTGETTGVNPTAPTAKNTPPNQFCEPAAADRGILPNKSCATN